uniref:Uncharacterized protein n=1 Tax=Anguilla anguilla TaxID=7936 RepID=A0A0E9XRR6_ANGAN
MEQSRAAAAWERTCSFTSQGEAGTPLTDVETVTLIMGHGTYLRKRNIMDL